MRVSSRHGTSITVYAHDSTIPVEKRITQRNPFRCDHDDLKERSTDADHDYDKKRKASGQERNGELNRNESNAVQLRFPSSSLFFFFSFVTINTCLNSRMCTLMYNAKLHTGTAGHRDRNATALETRNETKESPRDIEKWRTKQKRRNKKSCAQEPGGPLTTPIAAPRRGKTS